MGVGFIPIFNEPSMPKAPRSMRRPARSERNDCGLDTHELALALQTRKRDRGKLRFVYIQSGVPIDKRDAAI